MGVACSSESPPRADKDDGGAAGTGGSSGSAGSGGNGGADPCTQCITTECGAEAGRCFGNSACQDLVDCYDACADAECRTGCNRMYPEGLDEFEALIMCTAESCTEPCDIQSQCVPPTANGACDNFPRVCGCTATQNCIFDVSTNDTVCAAPGTTAAHARCTSETCGKGHSCVGGNDNSGTCRPYCDTDRDCRSTPFNRCIQVVDSDEQPIQDFKVCTQHCNLSDPRNTAGNPAFGACATGANCVLSNSTEGTTICFGMSTPLPTTCENHGDCAQGFGCSQTGTCQKWCRVGVNADCAATPTTPVCGGFTTRLFILSGADGGTSEYGFCVARATDGGTGTLPDGGPSVPPPP